jgi:hypothetical protein
MKHDISWMILGVLQETATCRFQEKQVTKKKAMTSKLGIYHYKWCLRLSILLFSCVKTLYYINEVFEIGLMDSCDHHAAILSDWYLHIFTEDE